MQIQPYLFFEGRCEEAAAFYVKTLGAKIEMLMRFKDSPEPRSEGGCGSAPDDKVMHMSLRIGDTVLMASDGNANGAPKFQGFSLSLAAATEAEAERIFAALSEGGQVCQPLVKTFFSPRFGMVADQFGVSWMVMVAQ